MRSFSTIFLCLSALILLNACVARPPAATSSGQCYCECDPSKGSYSYYTAINKPSSYRSSAANQSNSSTGSLPPVVNSRYAHAGTTAASQAFPKGSSAPYASHNYRRTQLDAQKSAERRANTKHNVSKPKTVTKSKTVKRKTVKREVSKTDKAKQPTGKADKAYKVLGKWYYPLATAKGYNQTGVASWYGKRFHGGPTASGEKFDMNALTAAHTTLPFNSKAKITNLATGANVIVRINDRGPFTEGRLIDVSKAAAERLGFNGKGEIKVRVEGLE